MPAGEVSPSYPTRPVLYKPTVFSIRQRFGDVESFGIKILPGRRSLLVLILCILPAAAARAQVAEPAVNYNSIYRYPFSLGIEVQFVNPAAILGTNYKGEFTMLDAALGARFPLPQIPVLQPAAKLGFLTVRSEKDSPLSRLNHTRYYLSGGLAYMHKFSKSVEVGAEFNMGLGYSVLPNVQLGEGSYSFFNFQASLGGRLVFNPTYNFSINLHPFIAYSKSFQPLTHFDGFTAGIGVTLDYRFGSDPDDSRSDIRSIQFIEPEIQDMFAAMQSYYIRHPVGEVTLKNTEKQALTNLRVSFFQPEYMNIETVVMEIDRLDAGEEVRVPITASFNESIFGFEGVRPLTGELKVQYTRRTRNSSQSIPLNYDLYDKNSLKWDDDRKVAAFITSGDSALANYMSYLRHVTRDSVNPGYSEAVQRAIQIYYGLAEIGAFYQLDPVLSYEDFKADVQLVDSINLPRETLTKLAGDCDDLMVLFNALMESAGIETAFITAPGHIYSAFSTGIPAKDYRLIHPDAAMTLPIDGVLWVPVEITFIGDKDFDEAWRFGAEEFYRFVDDGNKLGLHFTRDAQAVFRPVGFEDRDLGLQYGEEDNIVQNFKAALESAAGRVIGEYERIAREKNNSGDWNHLGVIRARFGDDAAAEKDFSRALSINADYVPARINQANIYFMREEYQEALAVYQGVENSLRGESGEVSPAVSGPYSRLLLSISQTHYAMGNFAEAERYSLILKEVNPELAGRYAYLPNRGDMRAMDIDEIRERMSMETRIKGEKP